MSKTLLIGLLVAVPLAAQAKPKAKGKTNAKVHVDRAAKAHQAGKYQVALSELETAYSIDPQPKLLYAIGQVHAKLGNCTQAVSHYEKFLATIKDKAKQEVVKQAISACKSKEPEKPEKEDKDAVFRHKKPAQDELPTAEKTEDKKLEKTEEKKLEEPKPEPPQEPRPEPAPVVPEPVREAPPPEPRRDEATPWYRDWLGDTLVLGGVGVSVASYFVYQSALSDLDNAEAARELAQYERSVDSAHEKRTYTIILAGAGATLVAAGVLRYLTRDTGHHESPGVSIVPAQGGGLITWSGGF